MIGSKLIFNEVDFNQEGCTVEVFQPESLSWDIIYYERADVQPYFNKRKRRLKEVPVTCTMITDTKDRRANEKRASEFISSLFALGFSWLQINDLYCRAVLAEVNRSFFSNTITFDLTFINLDGLWYGPEITTSNLTITNNGVLETDNVIFEIMPTASQVVLKNSLGKIMTIDASSTTAPVIIDVMSMTVKQSGRHAPLTPSSRFFPLIKGTNNLVLTGGTPTIKYREVVEL